MMSIHAGHSIIYPSKTIESTKGCGILPIGMKVECIYTSGLRWNLGKASMKEGCELDMANFVSTSNQMIDSCIEIITSHPVIWCTALNDSLE